MNEYDRDLLDLRDYLAVLRRQSWFIALTLGLVGALTLTATALQQPVYAATARLAVEPPGDGGELDRVLFGATDVSTHAAVLVSAPVLSDALRDANQPADPVAVDAFGARLEVKPLVGTTIIDITVRDTSAARAATLAQALAETYLRVVDAERELRVEQFMGELETRASAIRAGISGIDAQIAAGPITTESSLEQERDDLQAALRALAARRAEVETAVSLARRGSVVDPAVVSADPISPNPLLNLVLGLLVGLVLSVVGAFIRDWRGGRVRDGSGVRRAGLEPLLGRLQRGAPELVTVTSPTNDDSDEYRRIGARVAASAAPPFCVLICPPGAVGDAGVVAANIAVVAADAGHQVTVVDVDVRRHTTSDLLLTAAGADLNSGELINGSWRLRDVRPGLRLLTRETSFGGVADPLSAAALDALLLEVGGVADDVLIVAPPTEHGAHALEAGARAGGVVLVVHAGVSTSSGAARAVEDLERVGARLLGTVLAPLPATRSEPRGGSTHSAARDRDRVPSSTGKRV